MHTLIRNLLFPSLLLCALLAVNTASAQQSEDFGDYVVHYSAVNTDLIPPEISQQYGIQRSGNRAMLNVTVLKKVMNMAGTPVQAQVDAGAVNLTGQRRDIPMREIIDRPTEAGDAGGIYYVGDFVVRNMETYQFRVSIQVDGREEPMELEFRQEFFTQ